MSKWWMLVQTAKCLSTLFAHGRLLPHERTMKSVNRGWRREVPCMCSTKRPFLILICVKLAKKIPTSLPDPVPNKTYLVLLSGNVQKEKCPRFTLKQLLLSILHSRIPFHFNLHVYMYAVAAFFSAPEAFFTCAPFLLLLYPELRQAKRQQQMREEEEEEKTRNRVRDAKEAPKINENGTKGPHATPWS